MGGMGWDAIKLDGMGWGRVGWVCAEVECSRVECGRADADQGLGGTDLQRKRDTPAFAQVDFSLRRIATSGRKRKFSPAEAHIIELSTHTTASCGTAPARRGEVMGGEVRGEEERRGEVR